MASEVATDEIQFVSETQKEILFILIQTRKHKKI